MEYIGSTLREHMLYQPNKPAIISNKSKISYQSLFEQVTFYQAALRNLTGVKEKRIGISLNDPVSFLVLFFATVRNGWKAMPIDPKWTDMELQHAFSSENLIM